MEISFYSFNKRKNSTKRPYQTGTVYTGTLKEGCSVTAPVVRLSSRPSGNYAYIPEFGNRYYFVRDPVYDPPFWQVHLTEDELATYRDDINADSRYVLRSGQYANYQLMDRAYSVSANMENYVNTAGALYETANSDGCYILTLAGLNMPAGTDGGVLYFAVTPATFSAFMQQIRNFFVQLTQGDVISRITNVFWLPISYSSILATEYQFVESIFGIDFTGKPVNDKNIRILTTSRNILIPVPSWNTIDRSWCRYAPFASYTLQCMPFGIIPLDSIAVAKSDSVKLTMALDLWSGVARLDVELNRPAGADPLLLTQTTAQLGVPVRVAQAMFNSAAGLAGIGSAATLAAGVASENPALIASGAASMVGSAASASIPQVSVSGSTGSMVSINPVPRLHAKFFEPSDDDHEEIGYPLEEVRQLGTLTGFIRCAHGDIEYGEFSEEKEKLSDYLTGGFFNE